MLHREMLFNIIYALIAREGREATLFGDCAADARVAFSRALTGKAFPELWFELPLSGDPWFDFHVLVSHDDVAGTQAQFAGHDGRYAEALRWFAQREEGVRQLALSYDVSRGDIDHPAVQLLAGRKGCDIVSGFLAAAGRPEAGEAFRVFCSRIPESWFTCYTGVFPGRSAMPVMPNLRVECIVGDELQQVYAQDASVLGGHLRELGASWVDEGLLARCQELAATPFPLEFQFDVMADGSVDAMLGASVRFTSDDWASAESLGAIASLVQRVCAWGLADDRWQQIANTVFTKNISRDGESALTYCFPAFIKLRWRDGAPLDAKTYLLARAEPTA